MAELLDKQSDNIASVYADRAGGSVAEWRARMTAETWYTAAEAVEAGLADEVSSTRTSSDDNSSQNSWDLSIFNYAGREQAPAPDVPRASADPALVPEPAAEPTAPAAEEPTEAPEPPVGDQPDEPEAPAPAETPEEPPAPAPEADCWDAITAHLINPPAPSPEDAFARLREALL